MTPFEDIVADAEEAIADMLDEARDNTCHLLRRHGASADQIDAVMEFMEKGIERALRQELTTMRHNLIAATATRH